MRMREMYPERCSILARGLALVLGCEKGMHSGDLVELEGSNLTEEEKLRVDVQYVSMYRRSPGWRCGVT